MDTWINPVTGDYELLDGAFTRDPGNGLANAVYIRLMTPLGSYWGDAALGSRLHELQREKDLLRVSVLAKQYSEQALQPIIDDGRARSIDVTVEQLHNGRLHLLIEVVDAAGQRITFKHPVKVF
jgi:phage gp46-like protein